MTEAEQREHFCVVVGIWRGLKREDGDPTGVAEGRAICFGIPEGKV